MTVVDVLKRSPAPRDAIAVVDGTVRLTYEQLEHRVDDRVSELCSGNGSASSHPFRAGDPLAGQVVPFPVEADAAGVVELLAVWRSGSIPAPLNVRLAVAEKEAVRQRLATPAVPAGTQVVLWTSGTSGRPRGVALSFENLEHSTRAVAERLSLTADDTWLATLSPAHVGGLALVVRSLLLGGTLLCAGAFDASRMWDLLEGNGSSVSLVPTHVSLVPTQLLRLLDHRPESDAPRALRCVLVGGAYAPASLVERALGRGWPLALTYGATEATSQVATSAPDLTRRKPGTVGPPLSGVELRLTAGGEIVVRGPTRALGYVGSDREALDDGSGWYHTGDLGRLDDDGHLWITGRRIDRIVTGGVTVDAVEVEEALRAHPTVLDACVVGIPDDEWGERIAVWIEPVEGEFDVESVSADLRERLSGSKLPRVWHAAGGLPRNANGKVDRAKVRETLEAFRRESG